jgi:hypothetical protein
MEPLYPSLANILDRVKVFIDRICAVRDKDEGLPPSCPTTLATILTHHFASMTLHLHLYRAHTPADLSVGEEESISDNTLVEGTVLHRDAAYVFILLSLLSSSSLS